MNDSDSDDEYGPITATWGLQTPSSTSTTNESNATETAGWDSLLDPNIKAGPNDLGSGNLHRRGTNFKPIDEKLILAKRLNIQIPKQKMLEAIRQTEKSLGLPEDKSARKGGKTNNKKKKPKADSSPAKFSRRNNGTLPRKSVEPVPSTIRPPPPGSTNTNWLQSDLVDTPFWEEKEVYEKIITRDIYNNILVQRFFFTSVYRRLQRHLIHLLRVKMIVRRMLRIQTKPGQIQIQIIGQHLQRQHKVIHLINGTN